MSGLLGVLHVGVSGFQAQSSAIAATARNVANLGTRGYSRESVDLQAEKGGPIAGVRSGGLLRAGSPLLSARERSQAGTGGRAEATAQALLDLEGDMMAGGDLAETLSRFFGAADRLAGSPLDESLRGAVVDRARDAASVFRGASKALDAAAADSEQRIADVSRDASQLAARIAELNRTLAADPDPVLADQRELAARDLANLVGGQGRVDPDGQLRFVTAGGAVLVDGVRAARLEAVPQAGGAARVVVRDGEHTEDVTDRLDGGRLGGELAFRDGSIGRARAALDDLACDVATQVNAVHRAGVALDGVTTGRDLFVAPGGRSGAAAAMAVDPAIAADPRLLGAAGAGQGKSGGAQALALASLAGFTDQAVKIVGDVGAEAAAAETDRTRETARADGLAAARDALSGVSQEEEMGRLVAFQRAAQASMQVVATISDLLGELVERL